MQTLDVLIPHFNDPLGLAISLRSVAAQTWDGKLRIVIADDGSDQISRRAVRKIAERSPLKPVVLQNEINRGRPYTRNVLLDSIESNYVSWLDAGDEWYSAKLTDQFNDLELFDSAGLTSSPTWMTCNYDWVWKGSRRKLNVQRTDQDQPKALLTGSNLRAYLWTLLGPAKTFKDVGWFDERLPRLQDLDYFIRFTLRGGVIRTTLNQRAKCVYHKSDLGRDAEEIRQCNQLIFDKHRVLFNQYGDVFVKMRLYNMEMLSARYAHNNSNNSLKWHYFWNAFRVKPIKFLNHVRMKGIGAI